MHKHPWFTAKKDTPLCGFLLTCICYVHSEGLKARLRKQQPSLLLGLLLATLTVLPGLQTKDGLRYGGAEGLIVDGVCPSRATRLGGNVLIHISFIIGGRDLIVKARAYKSDGSIVAWPALERTALRALACKPPYEVPVT
jgi:hypothetical protein